MSYPKDLLFSKEHECVRLETTVATIGITDFAQNELGDVVFVETRACDEKIDLGEPIASLESVKAVSDVYSPISGILKESNETLLDAPEKINDSPYEDGWIARLEISDAEQLSKLMSAEEYASFVAKESD